MTKIYRVQQESAEDGERNHFLVNYVDYAFDDFGGRQPPVYPGLSTVWGSLARSKVVLALLFSVSFGYAIMIFNIKIITVYFLLYMNDVMTSILLKVET